MKKSFFKLLFLGSLSTVSMNLLACDSLKEICQGDKVIVELKRSLRTGIVQKISSELGYVVQLSTGQSMKVSRQQLVKTKGCIKDGTLCAGDEVFSDRLRAGKVLGIFHTDRVVVRFEHSRLKDRILLPGQLSRTQGCTPDEYCVGDKVSDRNGEEGRLVGFFPKGKVIVNYGDGKESHNLSWSTEDLTVTEAKK